jgi:site-specific DNA recombinase
VLGEALRGPLLAGFRVHNGDIYQGNWEPILDVETHRRLVATKSTSRVLRRPHHLLTGVSICGLCGQPLKTMGFVQRNGKMFERYQCVRQPARDNCGKVAITKAGLDRDVTNRLLTALASGHALPDGTTPPLERSATDVERALAEDREALTRLTTLHFVDRALSWDAYLAAKGPLDTRVTALEAELAKLQDNARAIEAARPLLRPGSRHDLDQWWDEAMPGERRDALHAAITEVTVWPVERRGGNRYDPTRVWVEFDRSVINRVIDVQQFNDNEFADFMNAYRHIRRSARQH